MFGAFAVQLPVCGRSAQASDSTSEQRPTHAVQRKVDCVVGGGQHVGHPHRQIEIGVKSHVVVLIWPQLVLGGVDQIQDGVRQLETDSSTADGH